MPSVFCRIKTKPGAARRAVAQQIVVEPFNWDNGDLVFEDRPGIGIELDEAKLETYRI